MNINNKRKDSFQPRIKKIYVTDDAYQDELTGKIIREYPDSEVIRITKEDYLSQDFDIRRDALLLMRSKGKVFKPCPGTSRDYLCCNYYVINQTQNCPLDCTYCILRYYSNYPGFLVYTDIRKILDEVRNFLGDNPRRLIRLGTGELSDSLALPAAREFAMHLITDIQKFPNVAIELKTKTAYIDNFLELENKDRIIFSWSLNPQSLIEQEEFKTAVLQERLSAAARAARSGFLVGFHFDPLINTEQFRTKYGNLVEELFMAVPPDKIAWISLGSLRYPPETKEKIARQFPGTRIIYDEFIRGMDGKLRYAKPLREEMYGFVYEKLREIGGREIFIYFCMESPDVWRHITGSAFKSNEEFEETFSKNLLTRFPESFYLTTNINPAHRIKE